MHENHFNLAQKLGRALLNRDMRLAVAESCTGGGLAYQLTAVPGCSNWFERGFVVYTNQAKMELLEVKADCLQRYGAVSEQTALQMVEGTLLHSHADVAISITGIAGPGGGSVDKPVGAVWFGLGFATNPQAVQAKYAFLTGGRKQVRYDSIGIAIKWLLFELEALKSTGCDE